MRLIALLVALMFVLTAFSQSKKAKEKETKKYPQIFIEANSIQFGEVEQYSESIKSFKIFNKGEADLKIAYCTGSNSSTIVSCDNLVIKPRESAMVQVKQDALNKGNFDSNITIHSNDPKQPKLDIKVSGNVTCNKCPSLP